MPRLSLIRALFTAAVGLAIVPAASSAAADRCRPQHGEHTLARSAQAVVLEHSDKRLQTLSGCSRRSGRRRVIAAIERGPADAAADRPVRLVGVRLAGTRVAYVTARGDGRLTLIADDALHGGRRHDLAAGGWPFGIDAAYKPALQVAWAVDSAGDVAWIVTDVTSSLETVQSLGVWRAGLGRRLVDGDALLTDLSLRDGTLSWRHDGRTRSVDLAAVAPTRCTGLKATEGTLDLDVALAAPSASVVACLRATGQTVSSGQFAGSPSLIDAAGPYLVFFTEHVEIPITILVDAGHGTVTTRYEGSHRMVVDEHGSLAWIDGRGLWVHDAGGTRKVAEPGAGAGPLHRDGSTVTWTGGGPTVTLNP